MRLLKPLRTGRTGARRRSQNPETKYEGWTNYETWALWLWISNEGETLDYWLGRADELYKLNAPHAKGKVRGSLFTAAELARNDLAGELKDSVEGDAPELEGVYMDLLNSALSEIQYYEIAESLVNYREKRQ